MESAALELLEPVLPRKNTTVREEIKNWAVHNNCSRFYDPTYDVKQNETELYDTCNEFLHKAQITREQLEEVPEPS